MLSAKTLAIPVMILTWAIIAQASVPIIVETGAGRRQAMNLCSEASNQLIKGDIGSAKHNVDRALQMDPKLWPALYVRAEIFAHEGKYDLAIRDCNEALRQNRFFIDAALLRARINVRLGKYAEASKELNSLVSMRPATVILARVLSDRAWFQYMPGCIVSQRATGNQRRKSCLQHLAVEGREYHRYTCRSLCGDG